MKNSVYFALLSLSMLFTCLSARAQDFSTTVFDGPDKPVMTSAPSHRIPALVQTSDGTLLGVADYRYGLSDVGVGSTPSRIELWYKRSSDMGKTWTDHQVVSERSSRRTDWKYAMGDASLLADRESSEVLLMCAAGSVSNGASTAANPIKIGSFRSQDNGQTWDDGEELTEQIYALFGGDATAIFITSGRLCQSRYIKVGSHYRIYAAFPVRTASRGNSTGVIYSDDFGHEWHLLGMDEAFPEGTVYEEGKVEEMPDGNVALMVRDDNGTKGTDYAEKNFNVFHYTDVKHGNGVWSTAQSGITGMANACNSAFILVPARRTADGKNVYVMLTTVPFHTQYIRDVENNYGRKGVGFYYKEVTSPADYDSGASLAASWQQGYQVTQLCSAYADMLLLTDGYVGLFLEDNGRQGTGADGNKETEAYDIVYYHLSLATVTGGRYVTDLSYDGHDDYLGIADQLKLTARPLLLFDVQGRAASTEVPTGIVVGNGKKYFSGGYTYGCGVSTP